MTPRDLNTQIDRDRVDEESGGPSFPAALLADWRLWAGVVVTTALAWYAFTHTITGPVDEFLFAAIAVSLAVVAVGRPVRRAWT